MNKKSLELDVKAVADDGSFELYAAVFNNVDRDGDVILPGAFANLDEFLRDGFIANNHEHNDLPIGYPTAATQDDIGLKVSGRFHTTDEAQESRTVIKERLDAGKSVKCSIGYVVNDAGGEMRGRDSVRVIKSLDVWEASFVNVPANPRAQVTSVKSKSAKLITLEDAQAILDGIKSGRTISAANHAKLSAYADDLHAHGTAACKMAKGLKEFLAPHAPDAKDDDEGDVETMSANSLREGLRLRAIRGRARMSCP